jgi:adenosylcobinamide-GDP ribazoletransferase
MQFLKKQWHYFLTAVMFFTRIPIHFEKFNDADLNKATCFFPLIGILVGSAGAMVFYLCHQILPSSLAILISMAATILITGAFHEDGLADAIDGLGGGWMREQVLTIMVDSRIGSYGAIGLCLALLIKYQALVEEPAHLMPLLLIVGHSVSRLCAVFVMFRLNYVKSEGKSKPLATKISTRELCVAIGFALLPTLFLKAHFWIAFIPVILVWYWFSAKIKTRIGGYTGDCLGAMQQLTEIAFYVGMIASQQLFLALQF